MTTNNEVSPDSGEISKKEQHAKAIVAASRKTLEPHKDGEALISTTCVVDPAVTEASNEIYEAVNEKLNERPATAEDIRAAQEQLANTKNDVGYVVSEHGPLVSLPPEWGKKSTTVFRKGENGGYIADDDESYEPKPINPAGNQRARRVAPSNERIGEISAMKKDANNNDILDDETIKNVKSAAWRNPITRELIQDARKSVLDNKDGIKKQFNDLVALYNVAHNNAFFFITAAEARLAIDYIKKCRDGHTFNIEQQESQDKKVYKLIRHFNTCQLKSEASQIDTSDNLNLSYKINTDLMNLCGIGIQDVKQGSPVFPPFDTDFYFPNLYGEDDIDKRIKALVDIRRERKKNGEFVDDRPPKEFPEFMIYDWVPDGYSQQLTASTMINHFAFVESLDLPVDFVLMNSKNISQLRVWGGNICKSYSKEEFMRRRVFGEMFTSEVYVCNKLGNNQLIIGSLAMKPNVIAVNVLMRESNDPIEESDE